jgi:putative Mg2+ transporter-C (MgtC) family protein
MNIELFTDSIFKLLLTISLTFVSSFERELHTPHHPGSLFTNMIVGVGSCCFSVISVKVGSGGHDNDPGRIAAQLVSGIGFLGSATVFRTNEYVKGINTAASLWISVAIGMGIGFDMFEISLALSLFTTLLLLINNLYKKCKKYRSLKNEHNSEEDLELGIVDD